MTSEAAIAHTVLDHLAIDLMFCMAKVDCSIHMFSAQDMAQEGIAQLLLELPSRWEKLGDLALLPRTCMASPEWGRLGQPLWEAVACALGVKRLAMQAPVADAGEVASCRTLYMGL